MKISIIATLYYSEKYIQEFYERIVKAVTIVTSDYEFIFVNDGSPDNSLLTALQIQQSDQKVVVVDLSRNFGHHKAIMTGLQFSTGEYIFLIDTDLEEDPELFNVFWQELEVEEGHDVVYGIQVNRKGNLLERISGKIFYYFFSFLSEVYYPADTLTARIMSRRYVDNLLKYKEKEIDIWGLFVLNGFNQKAVKVHKKSKGSSTYTFKKKLKMAIDSITSLSNRPLYYIFVLGVLIIFISMIGIVYILFQKAVYKSEVEGWASILFSLFFIGGLIMFTLGIIGIYLSKIFMEIKNRPLTIIKNVYKS